MSEIRKAAEAYMRSQTERHETEYRSGFHETELIKMDYECGLREGIKMGFEAARETVSMNSIPWEKRYETADDYIKELESK